MTVVAGSFTGVEFRARDYAAEQAAATLPRVPANSHPLAPRPSPPSPFQAGVKDDEPSCFDDPLRASTRDSEVLGSNVEEFDQAVVKGASSESSQVQLWSKEWAAFKRSLMQRFASSQSVSSTPVSDNAIGSSRAASETSLASVHIEELDGSQDMVVEDDKVMSKQEYVSRVKELKEEILRAWNAGNRVTSLKLSIRAARLLSDTSALQIYPTLFVAVTDILDLLGELVWDRIKRKAEYSDEGDLIYHLPECFEPGDVCNDAKETCYNWFGKIGSIRKLLPRIYLELSILRCWHFLQDSLLGPIQRLMMMMRGLADPLAFSYCHLYMVHCMQMLPYFDMGVLTSSINDITNVLTPIATGKTSTYGTSEELRKALFTLVEPSIGWIIKCICRSSSQANKISVELGKKRNPSGSSNNTLCLSIVLHQLLKDLPIEIISLNALSILQHVESSVDISLDQYLNYRLLGLRLCENIPPLDVVGDILDKICKVITEFNDLNKYLKVADAYLDIVLQCQMGNYLTMIMDGISAQIYDKFVGEDESDSLQSILIKILAHFTSVEDTLAVDHFAEILNLMRGSSRNAINIHILTTATRSRYIGDPKMAEFLLEISKELHDDRDSFNTKTDDRPAHLISRFVSLVDFGADLEHQLTFLVNCRAAFSGFDEIKGTIVHSCNYLAVKAIRDEDELFGFVKSCIAFNEITIPSVFSIILQANLYLETAEVALQGGLISRTDALIDSIFNTLESTLLNDGSRIQVDMGSILSLLWKLCSFLIVVPGNFDRGIMYTPKNLLSLVHQQLGITPEWRLRTFCTIIFLSAALCQNKLLYHVKNEHVLTNDQLFFGEPRFFQDLLRLPCSILPNLIDSVQQESSAATRGVLALQACNCIMSSFRASSEISLICSELIAIAKSCLHSNNNYLKSTIKLLDKHLTNVKGDAPIITVSTLARESATSFPLH